MQTIRGDARTWEMGSWDALHFVAITRDPAVHELIGTADEIRGSAWSLAIGRKEILTVDSRSGVRRLFSVAGRR